MSGKIPSKTTFTRPSAAVISSMDVLGYLDSNGKAAVANGSTDVDFVILSAATTAGDAVSCDPQPSVANLTALAAIAKGDAVCAGTGGAVAKFPGHAAKTVTVANATEIWTATAHGFQSGHAVRLSNSGGALPSGSDSTTTYYVGVIDANTFYLYDTAANAIAGGATGRLALDGDGTGTHSIRLYGPFTIVGKAMDTGAASRKIAVMFDKRYVILP